ncbi:MAG: glycosyltransferase [Rhodocyclales bacterium]|nr:glycosyltransferase [Rhodocyclales bacterium]
MSDVDLVIPCYNRARLVVETLESALAQQQPFRRIIVVDDGSTDDTPQTLRRYGDRIIVIRTENAGVQAARNTGMANATSPLVALCDSDDLLEPGYVARASAWMNQHPETDILFSNFLLFDERGVRADKFSLGPDFFFDGATYEGDFLYDIPDLFLRSLSFQPLFPSGMMLRKDFFERIGRYDTAFRDVGAEDWEFTLRAICHGRVAMCTRPLVRVRKHEGNDSRNATRMSLGEAFILEHALQHHPGALLHRQAILASVDARRWSAFDGAFAAGEFRLAHDTLAKMRRKPRALKFTMKRFVLSLPDKLRKPLWRLSQR